MTSKSEFVVAFVGDRPTFSEAQVLENLNKSAMPLTYVFPRKNGRDFPVLWVLNQISLVCINNKLTAVDFWSLTFLTIRVCLPFKLWS